MLQNLSKDRPKLASRSSILNSFSVPKNNPKVTLKTRKPHFTQLKKSGYRKKWTFSEKSGNAKFFENRNSKASDMSNTSKKSEQLRKTISFKIFGTSSQRKERKLARMRREEVKKQNVPSTA